MEKKRGCYFCRENKDRSDNELRENRVVLETDNFIAVPTVGCFQVGYLLVIPKKHYFNFGQLDNLLLDELENIVETITSYVKKYMKMDCIIFEHGTQDSGAETAASVDHAHIHIIPFEHDMVGFLTGDCLLKQINGFKDLSAEKESYLFLRDKNGKNYIVKNERCTSQFFRQIACKALDIPESWDWKVHKFYENMKKTFAFYKNLK